MTSRDIHRNAATSSRRQRPTAGSSVRGTGLHGGFFCDDSLSPVEFEGTGHLSRGHGLPGEWIAPRYLEPHGPAGPYVRAASSPRKAVTAETNSRLRSTKGQ